MVRKQQGRLCENVVHGCWQMANYIMHAIYSTLFVSLIISSIVALSYIYNLPLISRVRIFLNFDIPIFDSLQISGQSVTLSDQSRICAMSIYNHLKSVITNSILFCIHAIKKNGKFNLISCVVGYGS